MFAVIKTGGKQYRVSANDLLQVERVTGEPGEIIQFADVLAVGEGEDVTIGAPLVDGASVAAEVVEQGRGKKVIAFKKRRRQNSRRKRGHRQLLTTVRISEILTGGAKPSKKAAAKPAAKAEEKPAKKEAAPKKAEAKTEAPAAAAPLFTAPAGEPDDLTKIKGIGPVAAGQLAEQGITTYAQVAALTDEDVVRIDEAMPFSADQIKDWREQAKELAK
ncbi:50S ribosomal protein L21 [Nitratireductor rhodophyticola]|uniref:Large ribosomal subunit protein bL21 n=4 Tax=Nitratireductor TaxID=245876 RepID=A0A1H4K9R8_9HYPH|nr:MULTISPECIES: 50S ribosomal protein L21 [Nitratireductor]MBY8916215.1 50S ribosomal protein L21 [Nitratireductor rhodophyticola]MEC9246683.1 50S ribosomal protein L21 [Pseudomonadota bacterium]EIM73761.1 50S ribosomal protein L21/unknown domain fusion protein [Nitratireductor aquibiodomus RA22]MBY8921578.1 50S ribosomal protein L21 [Nitratireductor rhodophyticola]QZZ36782.1 50S ribosomal protein L21 [Nitratireductor kimnyeongensis]